MNDTSHYRADIDGLRAIAVLAVVAYHYGVTWLPGGFVGVDVFFVISGYLITSIIWRDVGAERFSIVSFYSRRIRRILPALSVILLLSLIAGYFLLSPGDYKSLGHSVSFAAIGLSNLFFYWNTGYFDQAAEMQPMLHTWSLGVEEQFYLVWPVVLIVAARTLKSRRAVVFALALVVVLGFCLSLAEMARNPKAAFYMPYARAWELAMGGLISFASRIRSPTVALASNCAGIILIALSFSVLSAEGFPGVQAILPVAGAALLLWPKVDESTSRAIAIARPVGLISYSLYLWHWPILVFYRHYASHQISQLETYVLAGLSILLAAATWRIVEVPFRYARGAASMAAIIGLAGLVSIAGIFLAASQGAAWRVPQSAALVSSLDVMWEWDCPATVELSGQSLCSFGTRWEDADRRVAVWGDSHAQHIAPLLDALDDGAAYVLLGWCLPIAGGGVIDVDIGDPSYIPACRKSYNENIALLQSHPEISQVIISGAWRERFELIRPSQSGKQSRAALFEAAMIKVVEDLLTRSRHVVILGDSPTLAEGADPACQHVETYLQRKPCIPLSAAAAEVRQKYSVTESALRSVDSQFENVVLIQPIDGMCAGLKCVTEIAGEIVYRDTSHFRRNLSGEIGAELARVIGLHRTAAVDSISRWK